MATALALLSATEDPIYIGDGGVVSTVDTKPYSPTPTLIEPTADVHAISSPEPIVYAPAPVASGGSVSSIASQLHALDTQTFRTFNDLLYKQSVWHPARVKSEVIGRYGLTDPTRLYLVRIEAARMWANYAASQGWTADTPKQQDCGVAQEVLYWLGLEGGSTQYSLGNCTLGALRLLHSIYPDYWGEAWEDRQRLVSGDASLVAQGSGVTLVEQKADGTITTTSSGWHTTEEAQSIVESAVVAFEEQLATAAVNTVPAPVNPDNPSLPPDGIPQSPIPTAIAPIVTVNPISPATSLPPLRSGSGGVGGGTQLNTTSPIPKAVSNVDTNNKQLIYLAVGLGILILVEVMS